MFAKALVEAADALGGLLVGIEQLGQARGCCTAHRQHTQTVAVLELEARVARAEFFPVLPDAEVVATHGDVMQQHYAALAKLGQPALEVVTHRLVGMQAVDMQKIQRAIGELAQRFIEGHLQQTRETAVARVVLLAQLGQHFFTVEAGVLVALPGIHRVAAGRQAVAQHGLAEGQVGVALVRTQLDQLAWLEQAHQAEGEGNVTLPGDYLAGGMWAPPLGLEQRWLQEAVGVHRKPCVSVRCCSQRLRLLLAFHSAPWSGLRQTSSESCHQSLPSR